MAEIKIYAPIGEFGFTASDIAEQLRQIPAGEAIDLYISSPGGDVFEGIAIYNELAHWAGRVNVYVSGLAASAASVIAMAGAHIKMLKGSMMMVHRAIALTYGNDEDHLKMAETLEAIDLQLVSIYSGKTGLGAEKIKAIMDAETWMNGADAESMGFANESEDDKDKEDKNMADEKEKEEEKEEEKKDADEEEEEKEKEEESEEEEEEEENKKDGKANNKVWSKILNAYKNTPKEIKEKYAGATKPQTPRADTKTPATITEIENSCAGASPEFVLAQLKAGATVEDAVSAWQVAQFYALQKENADLRAHIARLDAEIAARAKAPAGRGLETKVQPTADNSGDPVREWNAAIRACIAENKCKKYEAVRIVSRENPELRALYLEAYNQKR
ncbi:MAG TPA: Clp protease ClpP [Candidatus Sumerlaeota bacterium]|nr:MAG: ATP-dependent Clp protease proteolytic subunit [Deltaproteobacteria bacterium ADurb.BinA014]HOE64654.1 Clp protease ClpP [Candidatus Sumerlaeota bacterium]HOR65949.1 Clp protease ClpP [Candidatus Sumerlaeota bacterium]HPL75643.1 Clp protease ClpP [Candidatus Sumerlaeota bacterium]HRR31982.1 Clp protease ClpP [Candidatus Sumerlaeia bacterium]